MNPNHLQEWLNLPDNTKRNIFNETGLELGLPGAAVEKDWWVVQTLRLVFNSSIAPHTVFKGGTSLSKAWKLIDRFSEDIDLALDRTYLGFPESITKSQVKKLRKDSFEFMSEKFFPEIRTAFEQAGLKDVTLQLGEIKCVDQDPLIIEIHYPTLTDPVSYLPPRVLIEVGSRSLIEPYTVKSIRSFVGEKYDGRTFADLPIEIPCVNPERTFLEKIFLLHEEFQQPAEKIRVDRKSRHLYDLERLMDTPFGEKALSDRELYHHIVEHRRTVTPLRGIDYANHAPALINPLPPEDLQSHWEKDYQEMRETMLYNNSIPYAELIQRVTHLKQTINALPSASPQNDQSN